MVEQHAKLSASGSHRWITCPASVHAESGFRDTSSFAAEEGTLAHSLAEYCLLMGFDPSEFANKPFEGAMIDRSMASYVQDYVDYVNSFDGESYFEQRVSFSDYVPNGFGTADAIILQGETLHVIDLKYGKGVVVSPENNSQGMLYAIGAMSMFSPEKVDKITDIEIHIYQPRAQNIASWRLKKHELLQFGQFVKSRANLALKPNAPYQPEEKACTFCKAKPTCPALLDVLETTISPMFSDLDEEDLLPNAKSLSTEQAAKVLKNKKLIELFLGAIESHIKEELLSGNAVPGWKLVEGRSIRRWKDESSAAKFLEQNLPADDVYSKKIISPTSAEKLLPKGALINFVEKPNGAPTLVPESDKRKAITSVSEFFEDLDEGSD